MSEHRAVRFREDVVRDDDPEVGLDPKEISVERRVVEFAEAESVRDAGFAVGVRVRDDVSGIQKLYVIETANGAVFSVGAKDAFSKGLLMETLASRTDFVAAREIGLCHAVGEGQPCYVSSHSGLEALQLQRPESTGHFRTAPAFPADLPMHQKWPLHSPGG